MSRKLGIGEGERAQAVCSHQLCDPQAQPSLPARPAAQRQHYSTTPSDCAQHCLSGDLDKCGAGPWGSGAGRALDLGVEWGEAILGRQHGSFLFEGVGPRHSGAPLGV